MAPATGTSWIDALERAVNPTLATPRLADGVEFFVAPHGDGWLARKLPEGRYLSLTDEERLVLLDLDGERDVLALSRRYNERHGKVGFFAVSSLLGVAKNAAMLEGGPADVVWAPLRQQVALRSVAGRMSWLNRTVVYRKVPVSGVGPAVRARYRWFGRAFLHPIGLLVVAATSVAGFLRWLQLAHPRPGDLSFTQLLLVALLASLSLVVHELGHALAVVHFGRHVNKAGLFIMYGAPGGFVDTGDMWLAPRRQRIAVTVAGPIATLLVGGVISLLAPQGNLIVAAVATSQYLFVAANATPLLKLDGYYVLMDLLQVSNLRERGMAFVTTRFRRKVADAWREGNLVPHLTRTELTLLVYGLAATLWLLVISVVGLFLLPERVWRMAADVYRIGGRHVLGPLMGAAVIALVVLVALQVWGARAHLAEIGRLVQRAFDRSKGWAATALVIGLSLMIGGLLPLLIQRRSETSAEGWTHAFAIIAGLAAVGRGAGFVPRLRGSNWMMPMAGLLVANVLMVAGEVAAWSSSTSSAVNPARVAVLVVALAAALAGGRATIAALGADLRASLVAAMIGALLCGLPFGLSSVGGVMLGAGTVAGLRLLRRPIVSNRQLVDIPLSEELTDRRRIVHLRRAVAALVEPVVAQHGTLFGATERLHALHRVNATAAEEGWRWWFIEDGRFIDRNDGRLSDLAEMWGASIERVVEVVGRECGRRVADDAVAEAYLALPVRLAALVDEWLSASLQRCGCAVSGVHGESMAIRLTLAHLVRVPLRELAQAVGHHSVEAVIGDVNAVATRNGWGRWFRANGQLVDEMPAGRDDAATASELLRLLYARLTTAAGTPLTLGAVQHARDTLPWELRAIAVDLLVEPWTATVEPRRIRQRTPANWPVPA